MIARETARMHYLDIPMSHSPFLWEFLHKFESMTRSIAFPNSVSDQARLDNLELKRVRESLERLERELPSRHNGMGRDLISACSDKAERLAMEFLFASVFTHNDILAGNILYVESEQRVQLIDFEYGKFNYRGHEFGNHFCEYAGFDFDLKRWYPNAAAQRYFLEEYLEGCKSQPDVEGLYRTLKGDPKLADAFFSSCTKYINRFATAANLMWGFWALVQKLYSPIEFDYLDYARLRLSAVPLQ
jgi:ethanolamine kinase